MVSSLKDWYDEFSRLNLIDVRNIFEIIQARNTQFGKGSTEWPNSQSSSESFCLDIENFLSYQEAHMEKTVHLMKHIWFRGAILITKKFKMLKTKAHTEVLARMPGSAANSKFTYKGFVTDFDPQSALKGEREKFLGLSEVEIEQMNEFSYKGGESKYS